LPIESNVQLLIYTVEGKLVKSLVNERQGVGVYIVNFESSKLASGMYIYNLLANDFILAK